MTEQRDQGFREWCLVELMGHRRMAGLVSEATIGGAALTRIDVYVPDGAAPILTQFYGPSAIYALTPMGERECRLFAARNVPQPVTRYELAPPLEHPSPRAARSTCAECGEPLNGYEYEARESYCADCRRAHAEHEEGLRETDDDRDNDDDGPPL